jgi:hypothetical protein
LLTGTGHGIAFVAGAVTEVGFGVISSSMPALNHVIVVMIPRRLSLTGRFTHWLPTGNSNSRSFKEVYHNYRGANTGDVRRTDKIDVCEDEFHLETPYLKKYDFKHAERQYAGGDLESDPGGKIYYLHFRLAFSH